jgi:hypothetical protein
MQRNSKRGSNARCDICDNISNQNDKNVAETSCGGQRTSLAVLFSTRSVMWLMPNFRTMGCDWRGGNGVRRGTSEENWATERGVKVGIMHLLAAFSLLASDNGGSDVLEALGLVLLGLGLVPRKRGEYGSIEL